MSEPNTAIASTPATRDSAVLTPEAAPASPAPHRLHDCCRQGRNRDGHAQAQHDDPGQKTAPVVGPPVPGSASNAKPAAAMSGPTISGAAPRAGQPASGPPGQHEHDQDEWQQRGTRLRRGQALHLDQVQRQEEQAAAERRIEQQRQQVRRGKVAVAQQHERQHRCGATALDQEEGNQRPDPDGQRRQHRRGAPATRWRLGEKEHQAAQPRGGKHSSCDIQWPRRFRGGSPAREPT